MIVIVIDNKDPVDLDLKLESLPRSGSIFLDFRNFRLKISNCQNEYGISNCIIAIFPVYHFGLDLKG